MIVYMCLQSSFARTKYILDLSVFFKFSGSFSAQFCLFHHPFSFIILGEASLSYGYESTGKICASSNFSDYADAFAEGDIIGAYLVRKDMKI